MSQTAWVSPCTAFISSNDKNGSPLMRVTRRGPWRGSAGMATFMPSSLWSRPACSPGKSMNGYPMQNPCTAITQGRVTSPWRRSAAVAVLFGSNPIHRSDPGSPSWGANPLSQSIRSYPWPSAHPWLVVTSSARNIGGVRW